MKITRSQAIRIGELVARARAEKQISLRTIEKQTGISKSWLSDLEQGEVLQLMPERMARIADLLDINPARIERVTRKPTFEALPEVRAYFRAKYGLSPDDVAKIEAYTKRFVQPDEPDDAPRQEAA